MLRDLAKGLVDSYKKTPWGAGLSFLIDKRKQDIKRTTEVTSNFIKNPRDSQVRAAFVEDAVPMVAGLSAPLGGGIKVPTDKIVRDPEFDIAVQRVLMGKGSPSKLPILVKQSEDGLYRVLDGRHRLAKKMIDGGKSIMVMTDEKLYRKLAELEDLARRSRFTKGPDGRFSGSIKLR